MNNHHYLWREICLFSYCSNQFTKSSKKDFLAVGPFEFRENQPPQTVPKQPGQIIRWTFILKNQLPALLVNARKNRFHRGLFNAHHPCLVYYIYMFVDFYGKLVGKYTVRPTVNLLVKLQPPKWVPKVPRIPGTLGTQSPKVCRCS